jgi:hypothetical protein
MILGINVVGLLTAFADSIVIAVIAFFVICKILIRFMEGGSSTKSRDYRDSLIDSYSKEISELSRQLCYIKAYRRDGRINEVLTEDGRFIDPEKKIMEIPLPNCDTYTVEIGKAKFGELRHGDSLILPSDGEGSGPADSAAP